MLTKQSRLLRLIWMLPRKDRVLGLLRLIWMLPRKDKSSLSLRSARKSYPRLSLPANEVRRGNLQRSLPQTRLRRRLRLLAMTVFLIYMSHSLLRTLNSEPYTPTTERTLMYNSQCLREGLYIVQSITITTKSVDKRAFS